MPTINLDVIFPKPLKDGTIPPPVVIPPYAVAKQFDRINWTVYAVNPDVVEAEIEFEKASHKFFGSSRKIKKKVKGKGTIYADVPDLKKKRPTGAKYTVRGFDAGRNMITEIDPEIIVDEP